MATRRPNYRLAKIHRNYTVDEVARLYGVRRNTVRDWIKRGLPTIDRTRPMVILGRALAQFLKARGLQNKQTCQSGELYCVRCRVPKTPAGDMADYEELTATLGNLVGICPTCGCIMNRRVNLDKLERVSGNLDIRMPQALRRIGERTFPSVNRDFEEKG